MWSPGPAIAGSNVLPTIPVPDQTPPGDTALRTTAASTLQNGPIGVIVASTKASTVTFIIVST